MLSRVCLRLSCQIFQTGFDTFLVFRFNFEKELKFLLSKYEKINTFQCTNS